MPAPVCVTCSWGSAQPLYRCEGGALAGGHNAGAAATCTVRFGVNLLLCNPESFKQDRCSLVQEESEAKTVTGEGAPVHTVAPLLQQAK